MTNNETVPDSSNLSLTEQLTRNFYLWEKRGRGWQFFYDAVELEPVYEPFFYHYVPFEPVVDDGRRHTIFSSLIERLKGLLTDSCRIEQMSDPYERDTLEEPEPSLFTDNSTLYESTISLSPKQKVTVDYAEELILNLSSCSLPLSFEIIGTAEASSIQIVCREPDLNQVRQQLNAYYCWL